MLEVKLSEKQISIIEQLDKGIELIFLEEHFSSSVNELSLDNLLVVLKVSNALYRSGTPAINDEIYDAYITELKTIAMILCIKSCECHLT